MNPKFRKEGIVTVGTVDPTQSINLENPTGEVIEVSLNLVTQTLRMVVRASDDRNEVVREYPIQMDVQAWMSFYMEFFAPHIRRLSKSQYVEFNDLIEITE